MARKPIVQRIALEGGKQIEDQLKAIGEAGEKAFEQIRAAAIKADLAKFGASLKTFGSDLATVGRRVALAFAGLTTVATGAGVAVFQLAKSGAEAADAAGKAAEKTGLQIDAYGRLAFAAEQADVSLETFQAGMNRLNKTLDEAAGGSEEALKKFSELGVTIFDARGQLRPTEDIIRDLATAFQRMPAGAREAAAAIGLFGRSGTELLPFLNQGADGLRELGRQAERLGIVFTPEQFRLGDALGDALDEVGVAIRAVRAQIGLLFAPIVLAGAEAFRDFIVRNRDALIELGRVAAQLTASFLGDLVSALTGNDARVTRPWILEWRDAIVEFGTDVAAVVNGIILPLFRAVRDAAQFVADGINAVFGTNISGGQLLITAALLQLIGVFRLFTSGVGVVIAGLQLIGTLLAPLFGSGLIAGATAFFRILISGATTFIGLIAGLVGWPALLVAGLVAAGAAIVIFWDDIEAAALEAFDFIASLFTAENFAAFGAAMQEAGAAVGKFFVDAVALALEGLAAVFAGAVLGVEGFVQGVIARLADLAAQLLPTWDQIRAAGEGVWLAISTAAMGIWDGIVVAAQGAAALLAPVWATISAAGSAVWGTIESAATTAFNAISSVASAAISAVIETVGSLVSGVVEAFTGATGEVAAAADAIAAAIARATEAAGDIEGAGELAARLVEPFEQASSRIGEIMDGIRALVASGFAAIRTEVGSIAASIDAMISRIISALRRAAAEAARLRAQASSGGGGSSSARGLAGGGQVRGAGTATSDSILAWLSDGEFVMRTAAVRKYGPALMAAINSLSLPKDFFRGFNLGGLVDGLSGGFAGMAPQPALALAGGGFAEPAGPSGTPIVINLPGGQTIAALAQESPASIAGKLSQYIGGRSVASTGRKPGWRR